MTETAEDRIVRDLRRLTEQGGGGNFLVLSAGGFYVQFAAGKGDEELHCEAVSGGNLPEDEVLGAEAVALLEELGFGRDGSSDNYYRHFSARDEGALRAAARAAVRAFAEVYGCPPELCIEHEIHLGEVSHPTNPGLVATLELFAERGPVAVGMDLFVALLGATYLVPIDDPGGPGEGPARIAHPDGRLSVPAFTDREALLAWAPEDCPYSPVPGPALFAWAGQAGVRSVVLNPAGPVGFEATGELLELLDQAVGAFGPQA